MRGIITGDLHGSMRTWRKIERRGHEGKGKNQQSKERSPLAPGIESRWIVNGSDAEEAHDEKQSAPDVRAMPETKEPEQDDAKGERERQVTRKEATGRRMKR